MASLVQQNILVRLYKKIFPLNTIHQRKETDFCDCSRAYDIGVAVFGYLLMDDSREQPRYQRHTRSLRSRKLRNEEDW